MYLVMCMYAVLVICFPPSGCLNNGYCIYPGVCSCASLWTGLTCERSAVVDMLNLKYYYVILLIACLLAHSTLSTGQSKAYVLPTAGGSQPTVPSYYSTSKDNDVMIGIGGMDACGR